MPELLLPLYIETINSKIQFWSFQLKSYKNINEFYLDTLSMTDKLLACSLIIEKNYNLKTM